MVGDFAYNTRSTGPALPDYQSVDDKPVPLHQDVQQNGEPRFTLASWILLLPTDGRCCGAVPPVKGQVRF